MSTLYVSDLDGTLLNQKQVLSEETINIINELISSGLQFTIATARSIDSVRELMKPLNLQLPYILMNGIFIYDPLKDTYIQQNIIDQSLALEIIQRMESNQLHPLIYTLNEQNQQRIYYKGIFNPSEHKFITGRIIKGDYRFQFAADFNTYINERMINIIAIDKPEQLNPVYELYKNHDRCTCHFGPDIYTPGYYWLEINHHRANKGEATLYLKEKLRMKKIVSFGDNLNDLSLFSVSDEKYAVKNAHEQLLEIADQIIDSNEEHGVAKMLRKLYP